MSFAELGAAAGITALAAAFLGWRMIKIILNRGAACSCGSDKGGGMKKARRACPHCAEAAPPRKGP
ncbi:MAG: hypothetical protein LBD13_04395 [Spirochaetaceae bacterium]|nr:hypothetical protein [Spirochaetaceae bacterium]